MVSKVFQALGMGQTSGTATCTGSVSLAGVQIQLLSTSQTKARARQLVLEHGADFLLTVKDNQPTE